MAARDVILVTGAAGYIGSHVAQWALEQGSSVAALDHSGKWPELSDRILCVDCDVEDFEQPWEKITGIIHCAAEISVADSYAQTRHYFRENTLKTLDFIARLSVRKNPPKFVFLSSAAVYGAAQGTLHETSATRPVSPYGASKLMVEQALPWYQAHGLHAVALRLFNVAGAHPNGSLRESHDPETHLVPNAVDVALGRKHFLEVYGDDYNTPDGTSERDFVHVMDVARACLFALDALDAYGCPLDPINIGSGEGTTVLEVIDEVIKATKKPVPIEWKARRAGDVTRLVAEIGRAEKILGWKPGRSKLSTIIDDTVRSRA